MVEIAFGEAGQPCHFGAHGAAFGVGQILPLEQGGDEGADGKLPRFLDDRLDRRSLHLAVIIGRRRHVGQRDDIGHLVAGRGFASGEVEDRRDQDQPVEAHVVEGAAFEFARDHGGARRAIAFAPKVLGTVPAAVVVEPQADDLGDGFGILLQPVVFLGIGALGQIAEAGARRVDEDEVGDIEQAVGIIEQRIGRCAVVARIGGDRHTLGPERTHLQPDRPRTRSAIEQEEDRSRGIARLLDVTGGDHDRFGLAVVRFQHGFRDRRAIGNALSAEGAHHVATAHLRFDLHGGGLSLRICIVLRGG